MEQSGVDEKLDEARYFRAHMDKYVNDPVCFKYELSAFLTAARTVMQYLLEECKEACRYPGLKGCCGKEHCSWYDRQININKTLGFLGKNGI